MSDASSEVNDMHDDAPTLTAALDYLERGWWALPLNYVTSDGTCSCRNVEPGHAVGKHPVGGWKPSEVPRHTAETITKRFRSQPEMNVGIATGTPSGFWVLDIDPKNDGDKALAQLVTANGELPATYTVRTGSGGTHYYFAMPDFEVTNTNRLPDGIDTRGTGGQVVAAPSVSGVGSYEVVSDVEIVQAPEWVLAALRPVERKPVEAGGQRPATALTGYAQSAFEAEIQNVMDAPTNRNIALNEACFQVATMIPHGVVDEDVVREAFEAAGEAVGLGLSEVRATVRSAITGGLAKPRDPWPPPEADHSALGVPAEWPGAAEHIARVMAAAPPFAAAPVVGAKPKKCRKRTLDDFGNALRMGDRFADRVAWLAEPKAWIGYNGTHWMLAGGATVAKRAVVDMLTELPKTEALRYDDTQPVNKKGKPIGKSPRAAFTGWAKSQRRRAAVDNALALSQVEPRLQRTVNDFDNHPMLLTCANGVLDLEKRVLAPHDARFLMTAASAVSYDPAATCPRFLTFLEEVQPDPAVRSYLQKVLGYSMTGDTRHQVFFVHHGDRGNNGKSVLMDLMIRTLGGYAQSMKAATLIAQPQPRGGDAPSPSVASLVGRRFVRAAETNPGVKLDEALIKELTGGENMRARHLNKDEFDFRPQLKLHLCTNHLPNLGGGGNSMARRLRTIDWPVEIPGGKINEQLVADLAATELPGILNWLLDGVAAWAAAGYKLDQPQAVLDASAEHMRQADPLNAWVAERVTDVPFGPGEVPVEIETAVLYRDYRDWCDRMGEKHPMSQRAFTPALRERLGRDSHGLSGSSRRSVFRGITLVLTAVAQPNGGLYFAVGDD